MGEKGKSLKEFVDNLVISDWDFENAPPKPYSWNEIDSIVFPADRWLVEGLIPREGITLFAAISGEGKSTVLMHLASCLSQGLPWFNFPTRKARVLYLNLEMSISEMQRRGRMTGFPRDNPDLIVMNEDDFNLNEGIGKDDLKYKWLLKFISEKDIQVLIVDTLRASAGGLKEDKAEDVRQFFQKFQILKNSGVSVIFADHLRKPTQFEGKVPKKEQVLGSQDKTANAEVLLMIRRDETTGQHHIYQRKNRLGRELNPFAVKVSEVVDITGAPSFVFEYVGEIEDDVNKKEEAKGLIRNLLSSGEILDRKQLVELTGRQVGKKNLIAALKELQLLQEIDFVKRGRSFCYFMPKKNEETPKESLVNDDEMGFSDSP